MFLKPKMKIDKIFSLLKEALVSANLVLKKPIPFSIVSFTDNSLLIKYGEQEWIVKDNEFFFGMTYSQVLEKREIWSFEQFSSYQLPSLDDMQHTGYEFKNSDNQILNFQYFVSQYNSQIPNFVSDLEDQVNLKFMEDFRKEIVFLGAHDSLRNKSSLNYADFTVDLALTFVSNSAQGGGTLYFTRVKGGNPRLISANGGSDSFDQLHEAIKYGVFSTAHFEIKPDIYEKILEIISLCSKYKLPPHVQNLYFHSTYVVYKDYENQIKLDWFYGGKEYDVLFKYLCCVLLSIVPLYPGLKFMKKFHRSFCRI